MSTYCWMQGEWHPADKPLLSPLNASYLYGDGVFETLRARQGRFFRLHRHLSRLQKGLDLLGIDPGHDVDDAIDALDDMFQILGPQDVIVRITVTRGNGWLQDLESTEALVTVLAQQALRGEHPPARAVLSSIERNATSPLSDVKSCNRLPVLLAKREAHALGFNEAILLNHEGCLAEAASSNLFWIGRSELRTPAVEAGALPGVTREAVIEVAQTLGIPVAQGAYQPEDLRAAEAAFLTNSVSRIRPLVAFGERAIPQIDPAGIARKLKDGLRQLIESETAG